MKPAARCCWAAAAILLLCLAASADARRFAADEGEAEEEEPPLLLGDGEEIPFEQYRSEKREVNKSASPASSPPAGSEPTADEDSKGEKEPKETIAQILDEVLKEEFKNEEEKKEEVGKTFNETVASEEGTKETVVIISSSTKKKTNATAESEADAAAAAAAAKGSSGSPDSIGITGSSSGDGSSSGGTSSKHTNVATVAADLLHSLVGHGHGSAEADAKAAEAAAEASALAAGTLAVGTRGEQAAAAAAAAEEVKKEKEKEEMKKELEEKIEAAAEADVDRIIDSKDNEYVLSKPNDEAMGMNLDPQFVKDLTVLIAASAVAGLVMGSLGQPTINGYFVAGSLVGPGGLKLIKEIVQVQSVAQLGVQLLLFTLGLEFSMTKLRAVRNVALGGGLLQTALFAVLAGVGAKIIGTGAAQGAFVGALVAMSSTSIVVKVLADTRTQNTQQGQITIGTLILQDCLVGLLFAFMPVLATAAGGGSFDIALLLTVMARVAGKLAVICLGALVIARTVLPPAVRRLARSFGPDSFQLASIAFCLTCALATARQGVSAELGAFIAGVMLSATEQQEAVLHHLEPITQFFLCLFVSSTGLVLSPTFLLHHLPVLAAGALLVIITKTVMIAAVVSAFGYPADTSIAVGINLSQIGEFVFVLLSVANQQSLLADAVYMLLMGITALTLLLTPFLLQISNKLIPKARGYPNGPSAGDLEMAGSGPQRRRPSAGSSEPHHAHSSSGGSGPTAASSLLGEPPAGGTPSDGPGKGLALTNAALGFQGSGQAMSHSLQAVRTKLEHRGASHRTAALLSHSNSGGIPDSLRTANSASNGNSPVVKLRSGGSGIPLLAASNSGSL